MIERNIAAFVAARTQTIAAVAPLSQAQLDFCPRQGSWSVGEVADHLVLAEALYRGEIAALIELVKKGQRPYIRRSFAEVNVSPFFLPDPVLTMFQMPLGIVSRMIPQAVRSMVTEFPLLPTRNPDIATPRPRRLAEELKRDLVGSAEQTRRLIETNPGLDYASMISEHPLTGATNVAQIFGFLALHERRHQQQMERVRRHPRFPA
jgi:hypothetical protein